MSTSSRQVFVFDLDDTLYSERSFVVSGIQFVCSFMSAHFGHPDDFPKPSEVVKQKNWIEYLLQYAVISEKLSRQDLLQLYHNHKPSITLFPDADRFLKKIASEGHALALITDGRSLTQRNKIEALGLNTTFEKIVISEEIGSEKPDIRNFEEIVAHFPRSNFCFFGDNPLKDFVGPKILGWKTVGMRNRGGNIHPKSVQLPFSYQPDNWIIDFDTYK